MTPKYLLKVKEHHVKRGDTLESIAAEYGMTWKELAKFNWGTDDPEDVNKFLYGTVGCRSRTKDGKNFIFTDDDHKTGDGFVYVPVKADDKSYSTNSPTHVIDLKPFKRKLTVFSKCLVNFRTADNWEGSFGFDWIRAADTGRNGDVDYEKHVGSYGEVYATNDNAVFTAEKAKYDDLKSRYYHPFEIVWKTNEDGKKYENTSAWLSLFPEDQTQGDKNHKKCTAKLRLFYEIKDHAPDILRFIYDKSLFKLNKEEVDDKGVRGYEKGMDVEITCIKEFSQDQKIEVWVETIDKNGQYASYLAGRLMVMANSKNKRCKANVVFVIIPTHISVLPKLISRNRLGKEEEHLKKYLAQSLASTNVKVILAENLAVDELPPSKNKKWIIQDKKKQNVIATSLKDGSRLLHFLERSFNKEYTEYKDWYKAFIFNERGGYYNGDDYRGLYGLANGIPASSVVVFISDELNNPLNIITHELLHAMGLIHSFQNKDNYPKEAYTFQYEVTDNIMDYVDKADALWKWQWDNLHKELKNE